MAETCFEPQKDSNGDFSLDLFVSGAVVDVSKNEPMPRGFGFNSKVRVLDSKTVKQILS